MCMYFVAKDISTKTKKKVNENELNVNCSIWYLRGKVERHIYNYIQIKVHSIHILAEFISNLT